MTDTFPRQYARTQRLTLGEPRNVVVSPDGQRIVFLRSYSGSDPIQRLWVTDARTGVERVVVDPVVLLEQLDGGFSNGDAPSEERARRERAREGADGVVGFATDAQVTVASFALAGRLFLVGLLSGSARPLDVPGPVFDPRPDPTARRLAYVSAGSLRIANISGASWEIAGDDDPDVAWGTADFIAAEEMGRSRGYWWSPNGERIAATRVDTSPVQRWWLSNPTEPRETPRSVPYPAAGTANAEVRLYVLDLDGGQTLVEWDRDMFPYLAGVSWSAIGGLIITVQSRDQRHVEYRGVDPESGLTRCRLADTDAQWVELVPGSPQWLIDGRLVTCADRDGARRLLVDGEPVTPASLQVRSILSTGPTGVLFIANFLVDPLHQQVWRWHLHGRLERITMEPGVHSAVEGGPTVVLRSATMYRDGSVTRVSGGGPNITSYAEAPLTEPNVQIINTGDRSLLTALLLPRNHVEGAKLPVLLDPYGGPHAQRVVASRNAYCSSQWFADQGFAVIITDGRGTPGRGSAWERAVSRDLAFPVLEDQIDALIDLGEQFADLDLGRVGIRGWSFGGYLAALAVLRRPDLFHCAIAGAPVTDWRLYDTHYTERYLGDPAIFAAQYDNSSLIYHAKTLSRPLMLIHGLADDNVYAAHSLQLSRALVESGRPHTVVPLSGVSHMTPQEEVAENLLLLQLKFLQTHLQPA